MLEDKLSEAAGPTVTAGQCNEVPARLLSLTRALLLEVRHGERAQVPAVHLDSRLEEDLGIDSLTRAELGLRIERDIGGQLPDGLILEARTLRELLPGIGGAVGGMSMRAAPLAVVESPVMSGEPDEARTLLEVLAWHVAHQPARRHVTLHVSDERDEYLTIGDLDARARRIAAGLRAAGLRPGEACALMLPTSLEFLCVTFGILLAGGVPVPIYPPFRLSQLEDHLRRQAGILANAKATLLVTVREGRRFGNLLRGKAVSLRGVVTPKDLETHPPLRDVAPVTGEDVALIQYTSGSTGNPKGVVLTHAQLLANIRAMGRAAQVTSQDVFVSWLPLYHDMGLIGAWLGSLYYAMSLVLMAPTSFLARPSRWLWTIHRHRATITAAPNFAYELCAMRLDDADLTSLDLTSLRWAFNGAEPVSAQTMDRFARRFAPYGFDSRALAPVFGLAECALDLTFPQAGRGVRVDYVDRDALMRSRRAVSIDQKDAAARPFVSCGRVLDGYSIRIADDAGRALPERAIGRIEFNGPSATRGYFNQPIATAALFDGAWLDSGDLGYLANGELYITGRGKDLIIRGGHNIYPYDLEEAVGQVAGIRKGCVAVLGVGDEGQGSERVVIIAETREKDPALRDTMRRAINVHAIQLIGGPADEIVLVPPQSVLKTSSGKIRRAATRDRYLQGLINAHGRPVWWQIARLWLAGSASGFIPFAARSLERVQWVPWVAYGVWAWMAFAAVTVFAFVLTFLIRTSADRQRWWRRLARLSAWLTGIRIEVDHLERLPRDRPVVLVANHSSYLDAIVIAAALPVDASFVAKAEFRRYWPMRRFLESVDTVFVERFDSAAGIEGAREVTRAASNGRTLALFPEGTFKLESALLPFRMGAFVASAESGLPVVPVTLIGTRALLPERAWLPRRGRVRIVVGEPIAPRGAGWEAAMQLRNAARHTIETTLGQAS
ncbi:MAG: AMP-binding protein [Burkholderiales bacterium]